MNEHLRVMSNMIGDLRDAGHALTDEHQVRAVIRNFPASWANVKQILTHSENIKNFYDVSQHVILEVETRDAEKTLFTSPKGDRAMQMARAEDKVRRQERCNKLDIFLDNVLFGHGFHVDSIFQLDLINSRSSYSYVVNDNIVNDSTIWHARLGHIGQDRMIRLAREGLLGPLAKVNLQICKACLASKACMQPFGKAVRETQALELVHSDVCGLMSVKARHGASYFLTLIGDYTRYGYVYLISHRYEVLDCFKCFVAEVN
ncbi:hypothetical protein RJ640_028819 [Escallonia rubra]|uniref:GAG-pre-integrase domain-containing protein n=1 Tax=Escallonia rubra TaxID=112253 RepID=A0AA88R911_9ASTE|nr:hypothetical protein RJ640_028819 [Escallonia rubra]